MQRYILLRFLQGLIALTLLSMLVFGLARASGDPLHMILPMDARQEDYDQARQVLGLDKPLPVQYAIFISGIVKGDFGTSLRARRPVSELLRERLPNSFKLAIVSMIFAMLLAFPLGVVAAVKRGTLADSFAKLVAVLGQSLPSFVLGIVLIEIFSVRFRILPVAGTGSFSHYILPAFTLGIFTVAGMVRLLRSSLLEVLDAEYIKLARIKGLSETIVIWKHALKNALTSVMTFSALQFASVVTISVVVEVVFAWPGLGRLAYEAIMYRDFPVIEGIVLLAAVIVIGVNAIVDILYAYIDPRIRYRRV